MNISNGLQKNLYSSFSHIKWAGKRTLLELDFADTSFAHRFFDQHPYSENMLLNASYEIELARIETLDIPVAYQDRMRYLFINGLKDSEDAWSNIQVDYLELFYVGFSYVDINGFIFYSAAVMKNFSMGLLDVETSRCIPYLIRKLIDIINCQADDFFKKVDCYMVNVFNEFLVCIKADYQIFADIA